MDILTLDFETYYDREYSLSKLTTEEYVRDPRFEAVGVSVKLNDEPAEWFSGTETQTKRWLQEWDWGNSVAVAHNAMFDMAILNWHFDLRPKMIADTLSMLRAIDGPDAGNSLAKAAERYGLGVKGDEVINALGKRRLDFTAEELSRYGNYCVNDTELTYKLFGVLAPLMPKVEMRLIDLTMRMFTEPQLLLDKGVLEQHLTEVRERKAALLGAIDADKATLMSNPKLAELLRSLGVYPPQKVSPTTNKLTWAFGRNDEAFKALLEHHDPTVQAVVSARMGVKSTLEETRTERFIRIADRGTLPVPLRYYAAHTGRFGGDDKVNLQNLPRKSPLKKAIKAPPGYVIIDCDSSQIEARVLAWLAGQDDLVEFFQRNNDEIAAGVPKQKMRFDPYKIMASSIYGVEVHEVTEAQRFVGKTTILGCFGPDTKVLTGIGWKRIVEVQATDTLWDGEEWVSHEGVVPQGEKEVLTAQGLTATLDHEILTEHGWREWSEVATNPSLFQSAISKGISPLLVGRTAGVGTIRVYDAPVAGKVWLTAAISKLVARLGATNVQRGRRAGLVKSTGVTKVFCLTSNIVNAFSTVSQVVWGAVITLVARRTPTTAVGVFSFMNHGAPTGARSFNILSPSTGGMTQSGTSTAWIIRRGMNRVISASLRAAKTLVTNAPPAQCRQNSMTYDIAYAGPRNRYTVATDAGPIIVHNCGYGMGPPRFQAQLKSFNVDLSLEECLRIIRIYRDDYPHIVGLWREGNSVLKALREAYTHSFGREGVLQVDLLGIRLPNGMYIRYPNLRTETNGVGEEECVYDTKRGRTTVPNRIYGAKAVENVCQALARIIVAQQMLMIARRYKVAMTVHDSVVVLAPEAEADEARAFVEACMRTRPKWADGLPLNCESKVGASYGG